MCQKLKILWPLNEVDRLVSEQTDVPRVVLYPVYNVGCRLAIDCGDFEATVVHPTFGEIFLNGLDAALTALDCWEVDKTSLTVKTDLFFSE